MTGGTAASSPSDCSSVAGECSGMTRRRRISRSVRILVLALLALLGFALAGCGATKKIVVVTLTNGGPKKSGAVRSGIIMLDHRIGPVSFAEPKPQVTKTLGRGVAAQLDGHRLRFYPKVGIYVVYAAGPPKGKRTFAVFIVTRTSRYKTRSGVGVGSTLRQLHEQVKVRCYGGTSVSPPDTCQHEKANINLPFTVFNIDRTTRRVSQVAVVPGGD